MSIGQVSKIAGVHIKSLRYYDQIGVLTPAYTNPETGYRFYAAPQLYTLEAIQMCVALDIPLKEFLRFVDNDRRLHYGEILAYGSEIMQKKIEAIQESMEIIKSSQQEMEMFARYEGEAGVYERPFEEITVALIPMDFERECAQYFLDLGEAYVALEAVGLRLGYAYGYLYDFFPDRTEKYSYIQIINAPEKTNANLRVLPPGKRQCKWTRENGIEHTKEIFPEAFGKGVLVTAMESEIMSRDQDIHERRMELSIVV